jgi:CheY-like chemotaxis protein
MDAATLDRAFEPFFTTKDVGKGTGLGLSQVYGFMRQSSGYTTIHSEPGQGTTVKLYLPRRIADIHQSDAPPRQPKAFEPGRGETILVVEDNADLRAYSAGAIRDMGYFVLEASTGAEALTVFGDGRDIALLFTDIVLPGGLNGRELADEARRRRPAVKVLYTTGYDRDAIVHDGQLDPGVQLIGKPFTYTELAAKLRLVLDLH